MEHHIYLHFVSDPSQRDESKLDRIHHLLTHLEGNVMATLQELNDKLAGLATDIAAEKAQVQAGVTDLKGQIQALKDQIAAGGTITAADLDVAIAKIDAIDAGVKDISEPEPVA